MRSTAVAGYCDKNNDKIELKSVTNISEKFKEICNEINGNCVNNNENIVNTEINDNAHGRKCKSYADLSRIFIKSLSALFYK